MNLTRIFVSFTLMGAEWVLWVLVVCSIISVAIMIQKARDLRKNGKDFHSLLREVTSYLMKGEHDSAIKVVEKSQGVEARVALAGLKEGPKGVGSAEETMRGKLLAEKSSLERGLAFLGTMGNNAPFIGLFGTVLGIIRAFHDLSKSQEAGPGVVMAGISEALVATAIGLLVAIPAVIAYNYFQRRIKAIINNAEILERTVLASLQAKENLLSTRERAGQG